MKDWLGIFWVIIAAAVIGGGSMGCLGAYVIGMRIPFLSIVMSHAALVGAVAAYLLKLPIFPIALAASLLSSFLLGQLISRDIRIKSETHTGILFSLMIGLAFLGMGLVRNDITPMLSLMWGNLLFVTTTDIFIMGAVAIALFLFCLLFYKELKVILFSPALALVSGIPVKLITSLFLIMAAGVITANLSSVGGLLIYSLLTCPAAAAYEVARDMRSVLITSGLLGMAGAVGGFIISYKADLPTGACITLVLVFLYGTIHFYRKAYPIA